MELNKSTTHSVRCTFSWKSH